MRRSHRTPLRWSSWCVICGCVARWMLSWDPLRLGSSGERMWKGRVESLMSWLAPSSSVSRNSRYPVSRNCFRSLSDSLISLNISSVAMIGPTRSGEELDSLNTSADGHGSN
uniref:Uncharacterized protein n=1 Tax=Ixodes ricinus TaxID=34613 RepID=A0A6B0UJN9_IXORI